MNICSNCGARLGGGQTFCTNCGQPVTNQNGAVNQSPGVYNNGTNSTQNFYATGDEQTNHMQSNITPRIGRQEWNEKVKEQEIRNIEWVKNHPNGLRIVSLIGSILLLISLWLPLLLEKKATIDINTLITGKTGESKTYYSWWSLCSVEDGIIVLAYFSLVCIVLAMIFGFFRKYTVAMVFGTIAIIPICFVCFAIFDSANNSQYDKVSLSWGVITFFLGFSCLGTAQQINRKVKKSTNI